MVKHHIVRCAAVSAAGLLPALAAHGQSSFLPYASAQYEHNSNIYDLPNRAAAASANGDSTLADSSERIIGGLDASYLLDRQRLYVTMEGRRVEFNHFTNLSHNEYLGKLGLDWKLLSAFDGSFLGSQERVMAPFAQRNTITQLALDTDRTVLGKFNASLAPEWRLETAVIYHDLDSPIEGYPRYGLRETTERAAAKYIGFAGLTYGILVDYLNGKYRNAPLAGSYDQSDIDLTMTYAATGLSSFNAAIGHTTRAQGQGQGSVSAFTGELGYTRRLSGKTSVFAEVSRAVNSYIAAGGSELDSSVVLRVDYQPTFKTGVAFSFQETQAHFLGQTIPGSNALGRKDHTPTATLKINYQALRWLLIQPYATYQRRSSNVNEFDYTSNIIGIQFSAKMQPKAKQPQR